MHSRDYRDIRRTLNATPGPWPCHIPCILVGGTRESQEGGQRLWKNLALQFIKCRWPGIVCRFLLSPAKRNPVENWLREIVALCYYSLRKKKDPWISWNMYTDKTFWTGVCRYPLLGRDETDSFDLRGGAIRAMYMRKNKTCPANIRRILIVLNNTRTSPYTRHISTKIRRDLAKIALSKNRCYGLFSLICLLRNRQTGPIIEHVFPRGTLALPLGIERSI